VVELLATLEVNLIVQVHITSLHMYERTRASINPENEKNPPKFEK
jgi:hypothetical protein